MPIAQIKFTQGITTAPAGEALIGALTTPVVVSNGYDNDVESWKFEVLDAPPASTTPRGVVLDGKTPTYTFVPDARGCYLIQLTTKDRKGRVAVDTRAFAVPQASGRIIPPALGDADSLNFNGETRGTAPIMEDWLQSLDDLIISGTATTATASGNINLGDSICPADSSGNPNNVVVATDAARANGVTPVGISLQTVTAGQQVEYAGIGTRIANSVVGLGAGKKTWVTPDANGRPVRNDTPEPGRPVIGSVDSHGQIHVLPRVNETSRINVKFAPFNAKGDGSDDTTALRDAVAASIFNPPAELGQNFGAYALKVSKGLYKVYKPIHLTTSYQGVVGDHRGDHVFQAVDYCGPLFWVAPSFGAFPTSVVSGVTGLHLGPSAAPGTSPHYLELREYGAGFEVHGKSELTLEFEICLTSATSVLNPILSSSGERFQTDVYRTGLPTAAHISEAFETLVLGAATGFDKGLSWLVTTSTGVHAVNTLANALPADGALHKVQFNWSGTTGEMAILVDGVLKAKTTGASGTLVQQAHEYVNLGQGITTRFGGDQYLPCPDCVITSLRASDNVRNSAAAFNVGDVVYTPAAGRFAEDANTLCLLNADTFDGDFVVGKMRPETGVTTRLACYIPHRYDNAALYGNVYYELRNLRIYNPYGDAIGGSCATHSIFDNIDITGSKSGVRLAYNSYVTRVSRIQGLADRTKSPRHGVSITGQNHFVSCVDLFCQGYIYGLLGSSNEMALSGLGYFPICNGGILLFDCPSVSISGATINTSDEGAVGSGVSVEFSLALAQCGSVAVHGASFNMSESSSPLIIIDAEHSSVPLAASFDACFFVGGGSVPGAFKFTTMPATGKVVVNNTAKMVGIAKWIDPASNISGTQAFLTVTPQDTDGSQSITLTGAAYTVSQDEWLNGTIKATGTPGATCAITVPSRKTSPRKFFNGTDKTVTLVAAGGTRVIIVAPSTWVTVQSDGTNLQRVVVPPTHINVRDFGVLADGQPGTDDYAAVKSAIDTLSTIVAGEVFFPPGYYQYSRPVVVGTSLVKHRLRQETVDSCTHTANFDGPLFVCAPKEFGNIHKGAALVGSGKSARFYKGVTKILQLSDIRAAKTLNGLGAFCIEFFIKVTSTTVGTYHCVASSSGNAAGTDNIAFTIFVRDAGDPNRQIYAYINVNGTFRTVSLDNTLPLNTVMFVALDFDGSNVRLFAGVPGGVMSSVTAADTSAGTIVQSDFEEVYLGILSQGLWPFFNGGYFPCDSYIQDFRMSKVSRYVPGNSAPAARLDFDDSASNNNKTLVGISFNLDAANVDDEVSPAASNTDVFSVGCSWASGAKRTAYFLYKDYTSSNQTCRIHLENMQAKSENGTAFHWFWCIGSDIENLDFTQGSWRGVRLENNCFQAKIHKIHGRSDYIGLSCEGVAGLTVIGDLHIDSGKYPVAICGDFNIRATDWYIVSQQMYIPLLLTGSNTASFEGKQISISTENMQFATTKAMRAAVVASNVKFLDILSSTFETDWAVDNNPPNIELHNAGKSSFQQCIYPSMAYNAGVNANQAIFAFTGTVGGSHLHRQLTKIQSTVPWLRDTTVKFEIEELRNDLGSVTVTDADRTLTAEEGLYGKIKLVPDGTTPPTVGRNIIAPHVSGRSTVWTNATTQTMTVKPTAGTGVAIASTKTATTYDDGTNQVRQTGDA